MGISISLAWYDFEDVDAADHPKPTAQELSGTECGITIEFPAPDQARLDLYIEDVQTLRAIGNVFLQRAASLEVMQKHRDLAAEAAKKAESDNG